jgi:AraC-like DNA-binding protein
VEAKLNRTIWGLAKELGLEGQEGRDCLHAVVLQQTGKESLKDLTDADGRKVIKYLGLLLDERKHRPGRATPGQIWKMKQLAAQLGLTEKQLLDQVKRDTHVSRLEWQGQQDASNVIEALKAQLHRQEVKPGEPAATAG